MTDTIQFTDGTTSIDLYYDSSGFQFINGGLDFVPPEKSLLLHSSEYGEGESLVRSSVKNRQIPMELAIRGTTTADIADTLAQFMRLSERAEKYWIHGNTDKCYLSILLDGCSATTYYDVVSVQYNKADLFNYYNRKTQEVTFGDGFKVVFICKPFGYGDTIVLMNELVAPHFEESDGSTLAHGWSSTGSPTVSFDTTNYLIGSRSQKVVTDTSGTDGITQSVTINIGSSGWVSAYAWVYKSSGDDVYLEVSGNSSGTVATAKYSEATKTDGNFRKLEVGGTISGDTTLTLSITRPTGEASQATTFYVDKCFLMSWWGTGTVFNIPYRSSITEWMSSSYIYNFYESTLDGAVPYVDFDDIPGDEDAETAWYIAPISQTTLLSDSIGTLYLARRTMNPFGVFWVDEYDTADTNRTENGYTQYNVTTSWTALTASESFFVDTDAGNYGQYIIAFGLLNEDSVSADFRLRQYVRLNAYSSLKTIYVSNSYKIYTIGPFEHGSAADTPWLEDVNRDNFLELQMKRRTGTGYARVDFLCLMPVSEYFCVVHHPSPLDSSGTYGIVLYNDRYGNPKANEYQMHSMESKIDVAGTIPKLAPGIPHRFIFMIADEDASVHELVTVPYKVCVAYRPRTRGILGTI